MLKNDYSNSPQFGFPAANFVYFAAGSGNPKTRIRKYNTLNDTGTLAAPLLTERGDNYGGATGNNFFGYFFGGAPGESRIERMDYANDLASPAFRGTIDTATASNSYSYAAATGNADVAYYNPGYNTNIQRFDYSNDNATGVQKGKISVARYLSPGHFSGNQNFGYYIGGFTGSTPYLTTIDRIDYSNDTAAAAPKGSLHLGDRNCSTSSNAGYAYLVGGYQNRTSIRRLDYSNDTNATLSRGALNMPNGMEYSSATGDGSNGYIMNSGANLVNRLDYSNDTQNAMPRSPSANTGMSPGSNFMSGISSMEKGLDENKFPFPITGQTATNYGYFISGPSTGLLRIDYTNDTATGRSGAPTPIFQGRGCLLYTSPSPRDATLSRMPSSA